MSSKCMKQKKEDKCENRHSFPKTKKQKLNFNEKLYESYSMIKSIERSIQS